MSLLRRILGVSCDARDARAAVTANRDALEELKREAARNRAQSGDVQRTVEQLLSRMSRRS